MYMLERHIKLKRQAAKLTSGEATAEVWATAMPDAGGLLLCPASLWVHCTVSTQGHYVLGSQSFPSLSFGKGRWH